MCSLVGDPLLDVNVDSGRWVDAILCLDSSIVEFSPSPDRDAAMAVS